MHNPKTEARKWIARALAAKPPQPHDAIQPADAAKHIERLASAFNIPTEKVVEWIAAHEQRPTAKEALQEIATHDTL